MYMANEPREPAVIRGTVDRATVVLTDHGHPVGTWELDLKGRPYIINDMEAWLDFATRQINHVGFKGQIVVWKQQTSYVVNNGEGRKVGRGSNSNTFSYLLRVEGVCDYRLDVTIITTPHQQKYHAKVKMGEHTPKSREDSVDLSETYFATSTQKVMVPWAEMPGSWMAIEPEEYFAENPDMAGKLPTRLA